MQIFDNGEGGGDANSETTRVVIGSYGSHKATISSGVDDGIIVSNVGGVTIQDLYVIGNFSSGPGHGINLHNGLGGNDRRPGITIDRVNIQGYGGSGIILGGGDLVANNKSGFSNVLISNTDVHNNADAGIQSYGNLCAVPNTTYSSANVTIDNVAAFDNKGIPSKMVSNCSGATEQTNSGSGIVLGDVDGATVQSSYAFRNGALNNFSGGGPIGIWAYNANAVVIQFCTSFSNRSQTKDGGGFDLDGGVTNSVMQYNYSYDNQGAGYLIYQYQGARPLDNNVVRYNISRNDSRGISSDSNYGGIVIGSNDTVNGATNTYVYGNTIYTKPSVAGTAAGIRVWERSHDAFFYNNAVHTSGGVPLVSVEVNTTATFKGNNYFADGAFSIRTGGSNYSDDSSVNRTSLTAWQAAFPLVEKIGSTNVGKTAVPGYYLPAVTGTSTWIDPVNFGLTSTSLLRGKGIDPAQFGLSAGPRDYFGVIVPPTNLKYSIGASQGN
ncbi:hypothetical protein [Demequina oxidasica]|uniref:hypothetical protein n=1 Tax=Demequina oxidasica TaxID=676199 RepID=UPI00078138BF|nr:hypothetical protein [Demequina oxidasica]